jgi:hypothetical protein
MQLVDLANRFSDHQNKREMIIINAHQTLSGEEKSFLLGVHVGVGTRLVIFPPASFKFVNSYPKGMTSLTTFRVWNCIIFEVYWPDQELSDVVSKQSQARRV